MYGIMRVMVFYEEHQAMLAYSCKNKKKKQLFAIEKSVREQVQNTPNIHAPSKECFSIPRIKGASKVRRVVQE